MYSLGQELDPYHIGERQAHYTPATQATTNDIQPNISGTVHQYPSINNTK